MKKTILGFLILMCFGCGKKLTCTYNDDFEDIKINNKIVFNFKDNSYREEDIMVFKNVDEASKYFDNIKDYIEEFNLKLDENKIISNLSGEIESTKSELKERYEGYDFKCK